MARGRSSRSSVWGRACACGSWCEAAAHAECARVCAALCWRHRHARRVCRSTHPTPLLLLGHPDATRAPQQRNSYISRRAKEEFHLAASSTTDAAAAEAAWRRAQAQLEVWRRQSVVYQLYGRKTKTVMVRQADRSWGRDCVMGQQSVCSIRRHKLTQRAAIAHTACAVYVVCPAGAGRGGSARSTLSSSGRAQHASHSVEQEAGHY